MGRDEKPHRAAQLASLAGPRHLGPEHLAVHHRHTTTSKCQAHLRRRGHLAPDVLAAVVDGTRSGVASAVAYPDSCTLPPLGRPRTRRDTGTCLPARCLPARAGWPLFLAILALLPVSVGAETASVHGSRQCSADSAIKDSGPLLQAYRSPRQTLSQKHLMQNMSSWAAERSDAARSSLLEHLSSPDMISRLHPHLRELSGEQLLQRFTWEFDRLHIWHNSPSDADDDEATFVRDDSPLEIALANGALQTPCIRQAIGGPQRNGYKLQVFYEQMGLPQSAFGNSSFHTLRQANECLLFNANNLLKRSLGNIHYGAMTWVFNKAALRDRLLFEAWDAGLMNFLGAGLTFPGYGVVGHWHHLVEYHDALFNKPYPPQWKMPAHQPCCQYSSAHLFNRWWSPDRAVPAAGMLCSCAYYEVMTVGHVHLPEDLHFGIAPYADTPARQEPARACRVHPKRVKKTGMFGRPVADKLREFLRANGRPLLWADAGSDEMLIDPYVGSIAHGTVDDADVSRFRDAWEAERNASDRTIEGQRSRFAALLELSPPHLRVVWQEWDTRGACADLEADEQNQIIGVDRRGKCAFWRHTTHSTWELFNDGTCGLSSDQAREVYASEAECMAASVAARWKCVTRAAPTESQSLLSVAYCIPDPMLGEYESIASCEQGCIPPPTPPFPPRADGAKCCFGIMSCANVTQFDCPGDLKNEPCDETEEACIAACGGMWCV